MTNSDITVTDALEIAQQALRKVNDVETELEAQESQIEELTERVVALELRLSEQDDETRYSELTLDDKVGQVRQHAFEKATARNGKAKLDYDDIMWEVFEGKPGTKHCYKLMRLAAEDVDGYDHRNPSDGSQHLAVDARRVKQTVAFSREQSSVTGGGHR